MQGHQVDVKRRANERYKTKTERWVSQRQPSACATFGAVVFRFGMFRRVSGMTVMVAVPRRPAVEVWPFRAATATTVAV